MPKMLHACVRMHSATPQIVKSFTSWVMRTGFLSALWAKISSANVFLITGEEKSSNLKLTTLIAGDVKFAHYFANLVYSGNHRIQALMTTAHCNIASIINHVKANLIVVRTHAMLSKLLSREGFVILPELHFILDISSTLEKISAKMSRRRRRNLNAIRRLDYSYEITMDPQKLKFFYHKMYLPYVSKRHGKSVKQRSFSTVSKVLKKGGLLLVKLDGDYVSGILFRIDGDTVYACWLGIYEGRDQYVEEGAGQAALHFLINWSKSRGYKEINYGICNPFMNDGLFAYKKSWGMKVRPSGDLVLGLKVGNFNTSVMEFLSGNPFVFAESRGLSGLIFRKVEGTTEQALLRPHHSYYTQGLSRIVVVVYSKKESSGQSSNSSSQKRSVEKVNEEVVAPYRSISWSKRAHAQHIFEKIRALIG